MQVWLFICLIQNISVYQIGIAFVLLGLAAGRARKPGGGTNNMNRKVAPALYTIINTLSPYRYSLGPDLRKIITQFAKTNAIATSVFCRLPRPARVGAFVPLPNDNV